MGVILLGILGFMSFMMGLFYWSILPRKDEVDLNPYS